MEVSSEPQILCCVCGVLITANPCNMCLTCLRSRVDITAGLVRDYIIVYCPECEKYLQPPQYWLKAALESRELLTLCLKRMRGLSKFKIVDAKFLWTEPHSKRLKLQLTLQQEVFTNAILEQSLVVSFEVVWRECPSCQKVATGQPQWEAVVQLRQKVSHKRTFMVLEQAILRNRMHTNCSRIENQPDGLDFYFGHRSHALGFVDYVTAHVALQRKDAVQLVSHDSKSNNAVQHHTYSVEIVPLCREDLVMLPKAVYSRLGGVGPLVLVLKVFTNIIFIDPSTLLGFIISNSLLRK